MKKQTHNLCFDQRRIEEVENISKRKKVSRKLKNYLIEMVSKPAWPREIMLPSTHDNVAALLICEPGGEIGNLTISDELHLFFDGMIIIERWPYIANGGLERTAFKLLKIRKVKVSGQLVEVLLEEPESGCQSAGLRRRFDFSDHTGEPVIKEVSHPLLE